MYSLMMSCPIFSLELLTELIKSPDLFVLQVETDVYSLAKKVLK